MFIMVIFKVNEGVIEIIKFDFQYIRKDLGNFGENIFQSDGRETKSMLTFSIRQILLEITSLIKKK